MTLLDILDSDPPRGHVIRIVGGRAVYAECGFVWHPTVQRKCYYLSRRPLSCYANLYEWERALRFVPGDTAVEFVPAPTTEAPNNAR